MARKRIRVQSTDLVDLSKLIAKANREREQREADAEAKRKRRDEHRRRMERPEIRLRRLEYNKQEKRIIVEAIAKREATKLGYVYACRGFDSLGGVIDDDIRWMRLQIKSIGKKWIHIYTSNLKKYKEMIEREDDSDRIWSSGILSTSQADLTVLLKHGWVRAGCGLIWSADTKKSYASIGDDWWLLCAADVREDKRIQELERKREQDRIRAEWNQRFGVHVREGESLEDKLSKVTLENGYAQAEVEFAQRKLRELRETAY